jgi:macrolide-specific efflux system membrane fusion protein
VVSTHRYTVDLGLDDTDVASVAVGQPATVTLSTASSSSPFPGGGGFGGFGGGGTGRTGTGTNGSGATNRNGQAGSTSQQPTTRADAARATGTVTEVGQVASASSGVATFPVTVSFDDSSGNFNAGASVQVAITYAQATDVVQVPSQAVTTSNGTSTVTVSADGTTETRTVTTGLTADGMTEITSGLRVGEQVEVTRRFPGGGQLPGGTTGQAPSGATGPLPQGAPPDIGGAAPTGGTDG